MSDDTFFKHKFKPVLTEISFKVPLRLDQWKRLQKLDFLREVETVINSAGGYDVDYNPHFGMNFFFSCYRKEDVDNVLLALYKLVR